MERQELISKIEELINEVYGMCYNTVSDDISDLYHDSIQIQKGIFYDYAFLSATDEDCMRKKELKTILETCKAIKAIFIASKNIEWTF